MEPARVFDAHFHIIDPRFPLVPNRGFVPEAFTRDHYLARAAPLGIVGGAVVAGSFQGSRSGWLRAALRDLGPAFVGVAQLPASASEEKILALHRAGVRAVRFNLRRGDAARLDRLRDLARRAHRCAGWHAEVYVDGRHLAELAGWLCSLPALSIDHLGLSREGLPTLYRLVEHGAWVKASGFGRLDFDPGPVVRELVGINPAAVIFGTDLPCTRAPRPFRHDDLRRLRDWLHPEAAARVLHHNALALYRAKEG